MLEEREREYLLSLARRTIVERFRKITPRERDEAEKPPATLKALRGAFVTLHVDGDLRGCIGYIQADRPLYEVIPRAAGAAAFSDGRFLPLREEELERLRIEISVLSLPAVVKDPSEVELGKHGIVISQGSRRGLLLPQVATEHGWERDEFLAHGCLKAGLGMDAYRRGAMIEVFEAEVFGET
jgi:hypothetical protein